MTDPGRHAVRPAEVVPGQRRRAGPGFSDLLPRAVSGLVMIGLALGTAVLGGLWFALLWGAAAVAIHWEWQRMIGGRGRGSRMVVGILVLAAASLAVQTAFIGSAVVAVVFGGVLVSALGDPGRRLVAGAGLCYAGALVIALEVLRRSQPFGFDAIVFLFAVVWATDIMAYFGGRIVGGPKLWPRVSPSKTWAGFLIGIGFGGMAGLAVAPATGSSVSCLALGVVSGAVAQGGDLFESSLKRRFGIKDSSHLIPGHGGVMDRLDGFLAAAAFAAAVGVARFGVAAPGAGLFRW